MSGFLAVVAGHHKCDRCGADLLDLSEIRLERGAKKWLITCGWWCLHSWLVDPIPGLLDEQDRRSVFTVRGGPYHGKTLDEIDADGGRWWIVQEAENGRRQYPREAAKKWLLENS